MFLDKVRINLKAGRGGDGAVTFGKNGKPSGGNGGNGGSIYVQADENIVELSRYADHEEYKAEDGQRGGRERKQGGRGKDLILKVPVVTTVFDHEGKLIAEVSKHGDKKLIVKGGEGGLGNFKFRGGQVRTLTKFTYGKKGEVLKGFLELRLLTDVVFIGLPNAGKSSMLNSLSNANAKVAAYPFTTLEPNLARAGNITMLDLPGLIEGTASGKGLGRRFTRHIKYAKVIAHFLSLESDDIVNEYQVMRTELERLDPKLKDLPEVIVLTKHDEVDEAKIAQSIKQVKKFGDELVVTSIIDDESMGELLSKFKKFMK